MKDLQIDKFGSKMMVSSKSVNKIPDHFLKYAQNARIYDGGIGPAKGKQLLTSSTLGTNNKGAFTMNGFLYQIANSNIYQINEDDGTQTSIASLGYDSLTDTLVYSFPKGSFASLATEAHTYNVVLMTGYRMYYEEANKALSVKFYDGTVVAYITLTADNRGKALPAVKVLNTSDGYIAAGTGFDDGNGYILLDGQYVNVILPTGTGYNVDVQVGYYNTTQKAIIASDDRDLSIFDGETISTVAQQNSGIIEFCRGYSFLANDNILYISRPITVANPEYAYDFSGLGSQQIIYESNITGLVGTMNGLYVFTEDKVEFLGANALQNVAGSATFISTPLGEGGALINQFSVAASGDKIFYVTKNKKVRTINYIGGTESPSVGDLSSREIISMDEYLDDIDVNQPTAFGFYNKNDNTIQFHLRKQNAGFNDICVVYDIINDTWAIDKGKYYNYVVLKEDQYYGFSDINTSIFKDDTGNSMAGAAIPFLIKTQDMNQGTIMQKLYGGFFTAGAISPFTTIKYKVLIDQGGVFEDTISSSTLLESVGEIGGEAIGGEAIGGDLSYEIQLNPFERLADEGRIFQHGKRMQIEISSISQVQDFIIDVLGVRADVTAHIDLNDKF